MIKDTSLTCLLTPQVKINKAPLKEERNGQTADSAQVAAILFMAPLFARLFFSPFLHIFYLLPCQASWAGSSPPVTFIP